jgi:hypothetical protein
VKIIFIAVSVRGWPSGERKNSPTPDANRLHRSVAAGAAIASLHVDVEAPEAMRAVVPVSRA